ncbi:MAG: acyltransferase [Lachnospiraceae bacterium]|nr:acyltransferase [Lachnospiraceae bacterium]MBQ8317463.1 acyltransferase [Lachnospiraceae bacterium]
MTYNRNENIDIIRGFAVVLMVLGHSVAAENLNDIDSKCCKVVFEYIYTFHMPLFFIIAGFCYKRCVNYFEYVNKRVKRILVPYVVFSVVSIILRNIFSVFTLSKSNIGEDVISILFYGADIWFLYVMFEVSIFFPLIERIVEKNKLKCYVGLILILIIGFVLRNRGIFLVNNMTYYMLFFLLGYVLKARIEQMLEEKSNVNKKLQIIIALILYTLIGCSVCFEWENANLFFMHIIRVFLATIGCFASFLLLKNIELFKIKSILKNIGTYSLPIYIFNGYFISISRNIIINCGLKDLIMLFVLCNFFFGLIINYLFCILINKIKFVRVILGMTRT